MVAVEIYYCKMNFQTYSGIYYPDNVLLSRVFQL
jgi:hypothetical protein